MNSHLTVVTGTYNRLPYLQRMVASARDAWAATGGLDFAVCDGGSTDGTLDWLRAQPDVRLVEHGDLRGAIAAFMDASAVAEGRYLVIANDDIEFLPESLTHAFVYMEDNPTVGIGCFFQDRGGRGWHVEGMPVIQPDGRQQFAYYGQVCITPRWLWAALGGWRLDGARTYGGDNAYSAKVYEAGYRVEPIEGAYIHDLTPPDNLRAVNNAEELPTGRHPDSEAFYHRWPRGPRKAAMPQVHAPGEAPRLRVFYAPYITPGHLTQKAQKRGLRDALANVTAVYEFDYAAQAALRGPEAMQGELFQAADLWRPDLFLFQVHNQSQIPARIIRALVRRHPRAVFLNWNGDVWEQGLISEAALDLAGAFDAQLVVNASVLPTYRQHRIGGAYWDIAFEPDILPNGSEPDAPAYDVLLLANCYSDQRRQLGNVLWEAARDQGFTLGLYGASWPDGWAAGETLYDFKTTGALIRRAKLVVADQQWPDRQYTSDRLFNSLAAGGAALAQQRFANCGAYGLEDSKTCLLWDGLDDLPALLAEWLDGKRAAKRRKVAAAGAALARTCHSFDVRVRQLFTEILPGVKA